MSETSGSRPAKLVTELPCAFDRFTLVRRLGMGGMAEVFAAVDPTSDEPGKELVLKRILPHLEGNERYIDMFLREGRIAEKLDHDNIVRTIEIGEHDGTHYLVMEYVHGVSLKELAKRSWKEKEPIPLAVICQMIHDGAAGLDYVHSSGVAGGLIHRDISPDNLMVSTDGVTKILDFGIAKPGDEDGPLTKTGEIKGKVPFMSPEQVAGETVDGRSDLYSLGVSLYWLLTKKRPFDKKSDLMTLNAILQEPPAPPVPYKTDLPKRLEDIMKRLLEKDPAQRFQTGAEVCEALEPFLPTDREAVGDFVQRFMAAEAKDIAAMLLAAVEAGNLDALDDVVSGEGAPVEDDTDLVTRKTVEQAPVIVPELGSGPVRKRAPPQQSRATLYALLGLLIVVVVGAFAYVAKQRAAAPSEVVVYRDNPTQPTPPPPPPRPDDVEPVPDETEPDTPDEPDEPDEPRPDRPRMKTLNLKGPAYIRWQTTRGKTLGKGTAKVRVPSGVASVIAYDPIKGVRTPAPARGSVDYDALPTGKIAFRITPYAQVFLGKKNLGNTPFPPVEVKAGTVTVTLVFEGKEDVRTIKVPAGGTAQVKAKMGG